MSIGPFDPTAGDYGKLAYADPFADTTADVPMRQVAPTGGTVGINQPPATPPVAKNRNDVGLSPITMQGAVSVQDAPAPLAAPDYPTTEDGQLIIGTYGNNVYTGNGTLKHKKGDPILKPAGYMTPAQRALLPQADEAGNKLYYTETGEQKSDLYTDFMNLTAQARKDAPPVTRYIRNNQESVTDLSESNALLVPRTLEYLQKNNIPLVNEEGKILVTPATTALVRQYMGEDAARYYKNTGEYGTYSGYIDSPKQTTFGKLWGPAVTVLGFAAGGPAGAAAAAATVSASQGGDLEDMAKAAGTAYVTAGATAGTGPFANVGSALGATGPAATAISSGVASGVTTAVQGGDLGDVVKSGVLGGAGGYISGLGNEAAALEEAAKAAGAAGDFSNSISLTMQANALTKQAGLFSSVVNTAKAADAAISGDYVTALTSGLQATGTNLTEFTSGMLTDTFGADAFANVNIDDVAAAVNKTATQLIDGKDFDKALQEGIKEYVQQGGSLGATGEAVRDFIEQGAGELYENYLKPLGGLFDGLNAQVSGFDTPEGIKAIEDMVKQAGSAIDDSVLQPIKETAEAIYEPIETPAPIKAIEDVAKTAGSAAEDVVREVGSTVDDAILQPIKETAEAIYEPIDAPNIDINGPDLNLNLPDFNIDLSGMFDNLMSYLPSQRARPAAQQQTTDPVLADLSDLYMEPTEPEELLATRDYLSGLLRTI